MDRCFVELEIRVPAQDHDKFSGRERKNMILANSPSLDLQHFAAVLS